jgi:hypothetical protein
LPHADDLPSSAEAFGDLIVGEALVSQKNHLGADHHKIRQRIFIGTSKEFLSLIPCESDLIWAFTRHGKALPEKSIPGKALCA